MKKSLIALGVLAACSTIAFAESNVTLYGVLEGGVVVGKAKGSDTTVQVSPGFDQGDRWGFKGVEDLGNGYNVGFILEQGFNMDDGTESIAGDAFSREAFMYVTGNFGRLGFGRTGALSCGAQSNTILTGWALGTGYGGSSWTSAAMGNDFGRISNVVAYRTPVFSGFSGHLMYSNGTGTDTAKWSGNNHYYGVGLLYDANNIRSSLIFEVLDNKGTAVNDAAISSAFSVVAQSHFNSTLADAFAANKDEKVANLSASKALYEINYGLEYNMGKVTPMFAYQWAHQNGGRKTHMFGLSAKVSVGGGDALIGARYMFGKASYNTADKIEASGIIGLRAVEDDINAWNIGAAYVYPLSKNTVIKAYAGYVDAGKGWKAVEEVRYNGWQTYLGIRQNF